MKVAPPIRPKKKLGQHFLQDTTIAQKIVQLIKGPKNQTILEVGPGTGALTQWLVQQYPPTLLYLIEVDPSLAHQLQQHYPTLQKNIITADFLTVNLNTISKDPISLIGNFPYNISSPIFFKILQEHHHIQEVVCMIQKEVAERIAAPPGSKTYGLLSVLLQTFYTISYSFTVPPNVFNPPPKVHSAVIHLQRNTRKELPCSQKLFLTVVKTAFSKRRKMLRNALSSLISPLNLPEKVGTKRAEQLSSDDFIQLTQALQHSLHKKQP